MICCSGSSSFMLYVFFKGCCVMHSEARTISSEGDIRINQSINQPTYRIYLNMNNKLKERISFFSKRLMTDEDDRLASKQFTLCHYSITPTYFTRTHIIFFLLFFPHFWFCCGWCDSTLRPAKTPFLQPSALLSSFYSPTHFILVPFSILSLFLA